MRAGFSLHVREPFLPASKHPEEALILKAVPEIAGYVAPLKQNG
jgi:hypothetical protein